MSSLKGTVIAITGAGNGIGRALALEAASQGADLALSDIKEVPLAQTAEMARRHGVRVTTRIVDVASRTEMDTWAQATRTEHGGCDVIINNAGVALLDTLADVPYEQFQWVGTRAFLPLVKERRGTVANVGSIHSFIAAPNNGSYCAAKSAVRGFSDALREEVRGDGINVLLIMPGGIRTEIVRNSRVNKFINAGASQEDVHRAHNAASFTSPEQALSCAP